MVNIKTKIIYTISWILVVLGFLESIMWLNEFYIVIIKNKIGDYPWGIINENPWYYETPKKYGIFSLAFGLLFFLSSAITLCFIVKKKKSAILFGVASIIIIHLLVIINGKIQ